MRFHVNTIDDNILFDARAYASRGGHGMVWLDTASRHGSRSHDHAFEISLSGDGSVSRRRKNWGTGGHWGEDADYAATYDAWGWFIAYLYEYDATMSCYAYADRDDFHAKTHGVYMIDTDTTEPYDAVPVTPVKPRNAGTMWQLTRDAQNAA